MRLPFLALMLALVPAGPAMAQTAAPAATEPDPARLAAARRALDVIMPPQERDATIDKMLAPLYATIRDGMAGSANLSKFLGEDPEVRAIFDRYMQRVEQRLLGDMKQGLPEMLGAMTRAYARRFTVAQLDEITAFFATPTGQIYRRESVGIMSDPDIQAWQRKWIAQAMDRLPQDTEQLKRELEDHKAAKAKAQPENPS